MDDEHYVVEYIFKGDVLKPSRALLSPTEESTCECTLLLSVNEWLRLY